MQDVNIKYSRIWQIAYPIILGSIAQNLINFTDTAFLGRVGEIALGASALGGVFYLAVIMLGLGFSTGAQIIIARRFGEGRLKDVGSIIDHSMYFLGIMAVMAYLLLRYISLDILEFTVSSEAVFRETSVYMKIRAWGIFFAFGNMVFRAFYVGLTKTKVITYTTIVMAIVNIALDYILIFGAFGAPEMGVAGAALASVIAEASALVFFIIYTQINIKYSDYLLFGFRLPNKERFIRIIRVALPIMMQQFISLSVWFVFFLFIEKLGEMALAVSNIIRSVYVILMIPIWGFATATNTLVSYLLGVKRQDLVMHLIGKIVVLCFIGVLIIVSFGIFFPDLIMEVYTNDKELIKLGIPILKIVSLGALMLSIGFVLFNGISGTGKTNVSFALEVIVLGIYLTYTYVLINVFNADVSTAWTSEILYGILMSLMSYLYLRYGNWRKSVI
ncbi:MAG: MATE family efflux transporter [Marinilabiliales bacterium]|nr:MAG: MATE family efflux transporter [Marinilabiliales bacterium]